jgi:hypothetical protein
MQDQRHQVATALFFLLAAGPDATATAATAATVKIVPHEDRQRVEVLVDGKPFTEYRFTADVKKPVLYPLRTAEGAIVTRGWPLEPRDDESKDHPHHIGYWFNYGDVDGVDFWGNSIAVKDPSKKGAVVQRKIVSNQAGVLKVQADWVKPGGKTVLAEETTYEFAGGPGRRVVDRVTKLTAVDGPVAMPDTKEGTLGLRVARSLEHPSDKNPKGTGHYVSSEGLEGEAVWGTRGRWVMLTGKLDDGSPVTLAILDRPGNPGFPTYWHARPWGLFAANPLGQKALSKGKDTLDFKLPAKGAATFAYRLLILSKAATAAEMEAEYKAWTAPRASAPEGHGRK